MTSNVVTPLLDIGLLIQKMNSSSQVAVRDVTPRVFSSTPQHVAADYWVSNLSCISIVTPTTEKARAWLESNINYEPWQQFGQGVAIDKRSVQLILEGMNNAGLVGE